MLRHIFAHQVNGLAPTQIICGIACGFRWRYEVLTGLAEIDGFGKG